MNAALAGIRVLDLSINSPGPLATMLLADFGADVIQVVRPGFTTFGDSYAGDVADDPYINSRFQPHDAVMRNKRSLALDLKSTRGQEIFRRLLRQADVLLEEFRPGKLARLGFGYEEAAALNPRLIYCSLSGFGQSGPYRDRAGHDINYLALTGALDMVRGNDEQPINPQNVLSDNGGGSMSAVAGILMALLQREKSGEGQYIDANCTDSVIYLMADIFSTALGGNNPSREWRNSFMGRLPNYRTYRCADDRWLAIGALEKHFCEALFDGLQRPELMTLLEDGERWAELAATLEHMFAQQPRDYWLEKLAGLDTCVTPVLSPEEVAGDDHTRARDMIVEKFGIPQVGIAPRLSVTPGVIRGAPARPGQHSREILLELGLDEEEYSILQSSGITQ